MPIKDTFSYEFLQMRYDARDKRVFIGLQKYVAPIKLMAMGESPDSIDNYMRMFEKTVRESLCNALFLVCDLIKVIFFS